MKKNFQLILHLTSHAENNTILHIFIVINHPIHIGGQRVYKDRMKKQISTR